MDERERKLGMNQALFRQINERHQDLNQAFAAVTDRMRVVCECGDGSCIEQISLTMEEYEKIRRDAAQFVVVPGHAAAGVEEVVRRADGYAIVRKAGSEAIGLAEETDTRT